MSTWWVTIPAFVYMGLHGVAPVWFAGVWGVAVLVCLPIPTVPVWVIAIEISMARPLCLARISLRKPRSCCEMRPVWNRD